MTTALALADLTGRPVLDVSSATTVGQVKRAVLDPREGRISALQLAKVDDAADLLPWDGIKAIGPDAITIDSASVLRTAESAAESRASEYGLDPLGARLLTTAGVGLGTVSDLELNEGSGVIDAVSADGVSHPGSAIVGFGSYALVIEPAP